MWVNQKVGLFCFFTSINHGFSFSFLDTRRHVKWGSASDNVALGRFSPNNSKLQLQHNNDDKDTSNNMNKFSEMKSFESRLAKIEQSGPETLTGFYEPHLNSFSIRPGSASRLSVTSSLYSLNAIFAADDPSIYESAVNTDMAAPMAVPDLNYIQEKVSVRRMIEAVLMADWREDDLFQVPLLLSTVLDVDSHRNVLGRNMNEALASRVRNLVEAVLTARPMRRYGQTQPYSEYIIYHCTKAMSAMQKSTPILMPPGSSEESANDGSDSDVGVGSLPEKALPEGAASQVPLGLTRAAEVSFNELCRQIAFRSAGDRTSFDVMKLAYSLLTYITVSGTLSGTAGREVVPGEGPVAGTAIGQANRQLVTAGLAAFFAEQNAEGLWDKGQPIYKSFRKTGRNVGNAFVFSVDTVGSLLESLSSDYFRPHLGALQKTLDWIETHQTVEVIADYCDPASGQCFGKPLRGWTSPHLTPDNGPQAWSTAQTLTCVSRMKTTIRELMHKDVLAEFGGISKGGVPKLAAWDRLLDTDLGEDTTLKSVLDQRMIQPLSRSADSGPAYGASYSAILFGPPGTAKTTICEALADRMGWDFVVIDTAAFLADGLSNVAARIRYVFERLQALEKCVILFDEIEEFCLDREAPGLGMESRMLTTAMLTAINDLRRAKRSIFFLATNRLRAFDAAITRPGRFDMQLFVGTPNLDARCIQFRGKISSLPIDEEVKSLAESTFRSYLQSVWTENAMFMNFLEGLQFASACANIVASGNELTSDAMEAILQAQATVMTVRGAVRDEYVASMGLSRL